MDRYGYRPLYRNGSAQSASLLDLPRGELDYDALAVFIRLGYFVGDTTPFRDIRYLGPDPWLTPPDRMSRAAAIERYGVMFREAVQYHIPPDGDVVLPLSGGQDSRHILFELLKAGIQPRAVTQTPWPPNSDADVAIARVLTRRFGLSHTVLPPAWRKVRAQWENHALTDFCADEHAWLLPLRSFMRRGGTAFDGIAGDVLSAGLYLNRDVLAAMHRGDARSAADLMLGAEQWDGILAPDLYRQLSRDRAAAVLERELARHIEAPNPVSSYLFWNRTRREISLFGYRFLCGARMPYIEDAVYDHLTSLPAEYFLDATFHAEAINRMFPEHADIPFASKATRRADWQRFRLFFAVPAEVKRLLSGSRWIRRRFLTRKTTPADVSRALYLLHLERIAA
jgi:hypothetical protein